MGTRNTLKVTYNGKTMIDNYGQWDGYPTGQGKEFLHFFESQHNLEQLVGQFKFYGTKFMSIDEAESLLANITDAINKLDGKSKELYNEYTRNNNFSRNWGVNLLYSIAYGDCGLIILLDRGVDTWGGQEGNYRADITNDDSGIHVEMELEYHGYTRHYNLDNMPRGRDIDTEMKAWEEHINSDENRDW